MVGAGGGVVDYKSSCTCIFKLVALLLPDGNDRRPDLKVYISAIHLMFLFRSRFATVPLFQLLMADPAAPQLRMKGLI